MNCDLFWAFHGYLGNTIKYGDQSGNADVLIKVEIFRRLAEALTVPLPYYSGKGMLGIGVNEVQKGRTAIALAGIIGVRYESTYGCALTDIFFCVFCPDHIVLQKYEDCQEAERQKENSYQEISRMDSHDMALYDIRMGV